MSKQQEILYLRQCESTNRYLAGLPDLNVLESGYMVQAGFQSQGKGQTGNSWFSENEKNLLCSTLYLPSELHPVNQFFISKIAALACKELLDGYGLTVSLKWPNDLYIGDKKIGGILIENSIMGNAISWSIIGIGINVNQKTFDTELPNPVSMTGITGKTFQLSRLAMQLQSLLCKWFSLLDDQLYTEISDQYHRALYRAKGSWDFIANNSVFKGQISHVLPSGQLVVLTENGERVFWFKEVEFVL